MAIVIHGAVTLNRISSRTRTTTITDGGTMEPVIGLVAETAKRWHTAAQAKEIERQLHELAWYSRNSGGVYVDSDEFAIDDGLYEIVSIETATEPVPFGGASIVRCSLDLRRIGGGPVGGNISQRVYTSSSLQANGYSITSTPRIAYPIGSAVLNPASSSDRSSADGTIPVATGSGTYALAAADYNRGECKIWDTTGSGTEANWLRVWSPDHVFASPAHCVIENALVRFVQITSGNLSSHRVYAWTGAAWTEVSAAASGDSVVVNGSFATTGYNVASLLVVGPWYVQVRFTGVHASTHFTKTITLERGKPLAKIEVAASASVVLQLGLRGGGRWTFTKGAPLSGGDMQRPAFDDTEEAGDATLNAPEDNWAACFTTKSSSTGALGVVAWASSSLTYTAPEGGGAFVLASSTSLAVYIGGVKYDTSSAQLEAEAGTLTGGAVTSATVAGASGSGNDQVTLPTGTPGAQVEMSTNLASIGGSTVLALFRLAISTTAFEGDVSLVIRNTTAGSNLASVARDETHFAAANTWYWQAVVGSGWNGTDTLTLRATSSGGMIAAIYIDQAIAIAIAGSSTLMQVDDVAAQALTENIVWPVALASVR